MLHIYIYIDSWMCQNGLINPLCQTIPQKKIDQTWMETCQQWIGIVSEYSLIREKIYGDLEFSNPHILQHPIAGFRWDPWPTMWHQVACRTSATVGPESDFTWPRMIWGPLESTGCPRQVASAMFRKNHPTIKCDNQGRTHEGNAHGDSVLPCSSRKRFTRFTQQDGKMPCTGQGHLRTIRDCST